MKRRVPCSFGSVIAGSDLVAAAEYPGKNNADRVSPGIAPGIAECAYLLELNVHDSCFLFQFTSSRMFEWLILINESSGQRPHSPIGIMRPFYQEHLDFIAGLLEQDNIGGYRRPGMLIAVRGVLDAFENRFL